MLLLKHEFSVMTYAATFMTWLTLMLAFLVAGALLIPYEHQVAYKQSPKDKLYYLMHALWWATPLSWFLAPAVSTAAERAAGAALFAAGAALLIWARRVNPFFIPVIREPRWIVDEGPYRLLRRPGYAGFALMAEGSFLTLGHLAGVFPLVVYIGLLVARARRENKILYALPEKKSHSQMPLTPEQIERINQSRRDSVTRALEHLAGVKRSGSHIDNPEIRELEAALRSRLAQLDQSDDRREVSEIVAGTLAIINEGRGVEALPKTDS